MITHHKVDGYENFLKLIEVLEGKGTIIVHFSGSVDPCGQSWCPDCNQAAPIISTVLDENKDKDLHYLYVGVGHMAEWKDPNCSFRTDPKIKLTSVPTLLQWESERRLNDNECLNEDNVRMIFEEID